MKLGKVTSEVFKGGWRHFLTGNSYMLPVLLIGALLSQISLISGSQNSEFMNLIGEVGKIGLTYFVPIMAAYTAYSICDVPGIAPGLICGVLAQKYNMGYLGAFIGGFLAGYVTYIFLNIDVPELISSVWGMILPAISTIIVALVLSFVLKPPISWITKNGSLLLLSLGKKGGGLMGMILGFLGGFDYGGIFSKIQSTFTTFVIDQGIYTPLGIAGAVVAVPPLGMCLATVLAPKLYTNEEKSYAKKTWLSAFVCGFTEYVIPIAANDLKNVTISTVLGCVVSGIIAGANSLKLYVPVLGFPQIFFYDKPLIFLIAVLSGTITVAFTANILKMRSNRKKVNI